MATAFKQHTDNASAYIAVSGALNNTTNPITISLATGKGALFAAPGNGQYVTIWDKVSYPDPADDPQMEKATITARTDDSITLSRAAAKTHAGTPVIAELVRSVHLSDIETALNTAEGTLATAVADLDTAEAAIAGKSNALFDAIIAPSGGDYTTIGAAFAAGKFRLKVMPGTYTETTNALKVYTISGKSIYIEGMDKKYCTLKLWDNVEGTFSFKAPTVIKNMTLAVPASATFPTLDACWYDVVDNHVLIENCGFSGSNVNATGDFFNTTGSSLSNLQLVNCKMYKSHGANFVKGGDYGKLLVTGCTFDLEELSLTSARTLITGTYAEMIITNNTFEGGIDQASYPWIYAPNSSAAGFQNIIISNNNVVRTYCDFVQVYANIGQIVFNNNNIVGYSTKNTTPVILSTNLGGQITCIGNNIRLAGAKNGTQALKIMQPDLAVVMGNNIKNSSSATSLKGIYIVAPQRSIIIGNNVMGFSTTSSVGIETTGTGIYTMLGNIYTTNATNFTLTGTAMVNFHGTLIGDTTIAAPATTAAGTITNHYGGDTNFLGDPAAWIPFQIGTTAYKIPIYTA